MPSTKISLRNFRPNLTLKRRVTLFIFSYFWHFHETHNDTDGAKHDVLRVPISYRSVNTDGLIERIILRISKSRKKKPVRRARKLEQPKCNREPPPSLPPPPFSLFVYTLIDRYMLSAARRLGRRTFVLVFSSGDSTEENTALTLRTLARRRSGLKRIVTG